MKKIDDKLNLPVILLIWFKNIIIINISYRIFITTKFHNEIFKFYSIYNQRFEITFFAIGWKENFDCNDKTRNRFHIRVTNIKYQRFLTRKIRLRENRACGISGSIYRGIDDLKFHVSSPVSLFFREKIRRDRPFHD